MKLVVQHKRERERDKHRNDSERMVSLWSHVHSARRTQMKEESHSLRVKGQAHARSADTAAHQRRPQWSGGSAEERAKCEPSAPPQAGYRALQLLQQPCRQELTSPFYGSGNGIWEKLMSSLKATDVGRSRFWVFFRIRLAPLPPSTALPVSRGCDSSQSIRRAGSGERWASTRSALRTLPALNFWAFDWSTPQFLRSTVLFSK